MFYDLRLNAPMDIDDIRRANIQILEKEAGSKKAAAERVGMTYVQYLNYRNGAKEAKTGKVRGMRKETAWKFEAAYDKPRGWLDTNHDPTTNRVAKSRATYHLPKRHARRLVQDLIDLVEQIDDAGLNQLIGAASVLINSHPLVKTKARSST